MGPSEARAEGCGAAAAVRSAQSGAHFPRRAGAARAPPFEAGAYVFLQWAPGEDWQKRLLLTPCGSPDYESEIGWVDASRPTSGRLWYCQTPDDDVYPHWLQSPPLAELALAAPTALPDANTWSEGRRYGAGARFYERTWQPTGASTLQALALALGSDCSGGFQAASSTTVSVPGQAGASSGGIAAPTSWVSGAGPLPSSTGKRWVRLGDSTGA